MSFLACRENVALVICDWFKKKNIPLSLSQVLADLKEPKDSKLADLAFPCFRWSKALSLPPQAIAQGIAAEGLFLDVEASAVAGYLNLKIKPSYLVTSLQTGLTLPNLGAGKKVIIEYCSPNIAKRLGYQHIRSTLIGSVLANVYQALGYQSIRVNFVGDWGAQFAKLLVAVHRWASDFTFSMQKKQESLQKLFEVYVKYHDEEKKDPSLDLESKALLVELENNNSTWLSLWQTIKEISLSAVNDTLSELNVRFDHVEGESDYVPSTKSLLEDLVNRQMLTQSEGAWIVPLEGIEVPALLKKKDGTTLYLTRDLQAALTRYDHFQFDQMLYVVSEQQKLHFQQLFQILKQMQAPSAGKLEHVSFGTVLLNSQKMSTRGGKVVFLDDLIQEAYHRAEQLCESKNPSLQNKTHVARQVGLAALVFENLSSHRMSDINFSLDKALSFEGDTGPYVLYTAVRCNSVLEKAKLQSKGPSFSNTAPLTEWERELLLQLVKMPHVFTQVIESKEPYLLIYYLLELSRCFNKFYYEEPILNASSENSIAFRLGLVEKTWSQLKLGLSVFGLTIPDEM